MYGGVPGKKVYEVEMGLVNEATSNLFSSLRGDGEAFVQIMRNPTIAQRIDEYISHGGWYEESGNVQRFRAIMGVNFIGVPEIIRRFGIRVLVNNEFNFADQSIVRLRNGEGIVLTESSEGICKSVADSADYVLVYYPGLSYEKTAMFCGCADQSFPAGICPAGWYLLRKDPLPNSFNKSWNDQNKLLLPGKDSVPCSSLVGFAIMFCHNWNNLMRYQDVFGRCIDKPKGVGRQSIVGSVSGLNKAYVQWQEHCRKTSAKEGNGPGEVVGLATVRIGC